MIKKIIIFAVLIILFAFRISFADTREIILKDGQSFGDILFKTESPGKVFYKNKLLFQGIEEYNKNLPKDQINEISIINLKTKFHVTAYSNNGNLESYLIDKKNNQLDHLGASIYIRFFFLTESNDGKYAVLYYHPEDAESENEIYLQLIDTTNLENIFSRYITNGLPKNFTLDDKYQFSFEDKSGIVKGDLLEFFKKDTNTVDNSSNVIDKSEKQDNGYLNDRKFEIILFVTLWIILIIFLIKTKKNVKK